MGIGEIIYSMITLLLMFLIIFSPLLRKMLKSAGNAKNEADKPMGDIYESVDSHRVVERVLTEEEQVPVIEFVEPEPLKKLKYYNLTEEKTIVEKLDTMAPLKRGIIWKEILSSPVALRQLGRDEYL